ncbi:hypothetical protein DMN91_012983 [Ooceraea biroi]|uniref:Uncharacterized protein n=1 Tax=Ooceraea biroi TaxID=2015173 RepID=A0A3L8D4D4_OOCBI|nr:hypothetical protein DMN91_012983 [Ooceraea biroi]
MLEMRNAMIYAEVRPVHERLFLREEMNRENLLEDFVGDIHAILEEPEDPPPFRRLDVPGPNPSEVQAGLGNMKFPALPSPPFRDGDNEGEEEVPQLEELEDHVLEEAGEREESGHNSSEEADSVEEVVRRYHEDGSTPSLSTSDEEEWTAWEARRERSRSPVRLRERHESSSPSELFANDSSASL